MGESAINIRQCRHSQQRLIMFWSSLLFSGLLLASLTSGLPNEQRNGDMGHNDRIQVGAAMGVPVPDEWTCRELCGFYGGAGYNCEHWEQARHICWCCDKNPDGSC